MGFAVGSRAYALSFWQTTSTANHLLSQAETFFVIGRVHRYAEFCRSWQTKCSTCLSSQTTTNDQRNTASSANLIKNYRRFKGKGGDLFTILKCFTLIRTQFDDVAHIHLAYIELNGQCTSIFHGVKENRRNLCTQANTTKALVWNEWNICTSPP